MGARGGPLSQPAPYLLATLPPNPKLAPWIAQMLALDLSGRSHVLKRFKPEPMPPFLYKYLPSKGEFALTNIRDVLVGSVLRLSSPAQFNDPFELKAHFVMTATHEQKLERFGALAREQAPHLGWRAIQERVRNLMSAPEEFFYPNWQQSLNQIRGAPGIYCFAGSPKNHLMWGTTRHAIKASAFSSSGCVTSQCLRMPSESTTTGNSPC
jgi:hypothetical protein